MKKLLLTSSLLMATLLTFAQTYISDKHKFTHPSSLFNADDFERVRGCIAKGNPDDLVFASYQHFSQHSLFANINYKIKPTSYFARSKTTDGRPQTFITAARDAAHAMQCAMQWRLLSESDPQRAELFAKKAVLTLNAWAVKCTEGAGQKSDRFLGFGFQGYQFGVAGDLLQGYKGWKEADIKRYNEWLKKLFWANNKLFLDGTWRTGCDFHYWTNWPLANMASGLAIGICTEDAEIVNYVLKQFYSGHHNGGLEYMIPYPGFKDPDKKSKSLLAQSQESGRDQGHTTIDVALGAEFCQMAYNLGVDLFEYEDNRMLQVFEYCAKYNARSLKYPKRFVGDFSNFKSEDWLMGDDEMPFEEYTYCPEGCGCKGKCGPKVLNKVSPRGRGALRSSWHLIYNHYVKIKGLHKDYCYYTKIAADQTAYDSKGKIVGDPGSGDARRGNNSSAFDQIGWSSMMFTR